MDDSTSSRPEALLDQARRGDREALGQLLKGYRRYIELMARLQLKQELHRKVAPSDVAQETFSQAYRSFHQFRGTTEAELLQWLRRIVATQMATLLRRLHTQRRDVRLEEHPDDAFGESCDRLGEWLRDPGSSPSQVAERRERAVFLADALAQLREDYREVIILRHLEELEFPEIARRLGKTIPSVKNTWARAIGKLRAALGGSS